VPADVSVVIPTYNRSVEVERAIVSIREPDLAVEIIVVDDGSTDDTCERLRSRQDVRYLRLSRNTGQAAARNAGVAAASSQYVAFLDSDDWRLPGTLSWQLAHLQARPECALVYGRYSYVDQPPVGQLRSSLPEGDVYQDLLRFNIIAPSTAILRANVLRKVGGFDPRYRRSEEWDLWLRICARYHVCAVDEEVAIISPPIDSSHASGDPVKIEWTSVRVLREHLRSRHCRSMDIKERRCTQRTFRRLRIDLMLWKVLTRGPRPSPGLRLRCAFACIALDPCYMLHRRNLKNVAKLLTPFGSGDARWVGSLTR
jgi:glycosyltransferase involved in cell wall biosynthesis